MIFHQAAKLLACKWVFKKETDINGKINAFEVRQVAKVYTQTQGVDCDETFSPVANIKAIRIVFAIATSML